MKNLILKTILIFVVFTTFLYGKLLNFNEEDMKGIDTNVLRYIQYDNACAFVDINECHLKHNPDEPVFLENLTILRSLFSKITNKFNIVKEIKFEDKKLYTTNCVVEEIEYMNSNILRLEYEYMDKIKNTKLDKNPIIMTVRRIASNKYLSEYNGYYHSRYTWPGELHSRPYFYYITIEKRNKNSLGDTIEIYYEGLFIYDEPYAKQYDYMRYDEHKENIEFQIIDYCTDLYRDIIFDNIYPKNKKEISMIKDNK